MTYSTINTGYLIRLFKGEEIVNTLLTFSREMSIHNAQLKGIGGVSKATIGFYDLESREYEYDSYTETMEVVSLIGNISILDREPLLHAHVSLGRRDKSIIGGHLKEAIVGGTCEIHMQVNSAQLNRAKDEETGLSLWQLDSTV